MKRCFLLSVCCFFVTGFLPAQQFGGNPPSVRWNQINTDTVRIIFPEGLHNEASRVAAVVHQLAAENPQPIGGRLKKINIVLQNQTILANGYVAPGPYRSEFFLTAPTDNFDIGSTSWADMLSLHEYRHVMQFNNFRNGISKAMHILFGDDGYSLATAASVPDWFFEGDAVYYETLLSAQGRGRIPQFMNEYPALWQAGKKYSWMKLRNGSYKDYVPGHYHLGYLLVNYGYKKYGTGFWQKVTHDASAFTGLLYPFQKAVKRHSGVEFRKFADDAFQFYGAPPGFISKSRNRHEGKVVQPANSPNLNTDSSEFQVMNGASQREMNRSGEAGPQTIFPVNKKYVIHYRFPYLAGTDSLIYIKYSLREVPAFYLKDAMGVHKIRTRDISADRQFSYRNGKIVYAAYESDARWAWRDYSVIKLLDVKTRQQTTVTRKSKYFTPDISPDGKKIAAVYMGADGKKALHILNAENGNVLQTITRPEVMLFTDPKFAGNHSIVSAVRFTDGRMALMKLDAETGAAEILTPLSHTLLGFPNVTDDYIFFTASYAGNDEVMALRRADKKLYKITGGPSGKYNVNVAQGKIIWSEFTADGYQLMQADVDGMKWEEVPAGQYAQFVPPYPVSGAGHYKDIFLNRVRERYFEIKKYPKSTGLLHIHSWRPNYEDPEFSFSVYGENILNTLQTEYYYLYNRNDREHAVGLNAIFGGWFPYISVGSQYMFNRETGIGNRIKEWSQLDTRVGWSVPWLFTSGTSFKQLNLGSSYVLRNEFHKGFYKDSLGTVHFSYLSHFLLWRQQQQMAVQHILPRLGYEILFRQRHAITRYEGYQVYGGTSVYLPGVHATHSLELTGAFQQRDTLGQVIFSNLFPYSRGYAGRYFSRMWKLSANYHFPVFYPDWGFGNIVYFYRVRGNVFYDFTRVYSKDKTMTADQRSVGIEFFTETNWWNQYPLTFGFRISRLLDPDQFDGLKGTYVEFIMPVSIIPR
jgi:hypothetical protein